LIQFEFLRDKKVVGLPTNVSSLGRFCG